MTKSPEAFRTISEVAEWLETPAHVLRFWESKFAQVKPVKRAGGRRYYRPADMVLLGGIKKLLHDDGMTIKGAQKIIREQGVRYVSSLCDRPLEGFEPASDAPFAEVEETAGNPQLIAFPGGTAQPPEPDARPAEPTDPDRRAEDRTVPESRLAAPDETDLPSEPEPSEPAPAASGPGPGLAPKEPPSGVPASEAADGGAADDDLPDRDPPPDMDAAWTEPDAPPAAAQEDPYAPDAPEQPTPSEETVDPLGDGDGDNADALPLFTRRPSSDHAEPESPLPAPEAADPQPAQDPADPQTEQDPADLAPSAPRDRDPVPESPVAMPGPSLAETFDAATDPDTHPPTAPTSDPISDRPGTGTDEPATTEPADPDEGADHEPGPAAPEPAAEAATHAFVARLPDAPDGPPAPGPLSHLAGIDRLTPQQAEAIAAALPALEAVEARLYASVHV